MFCIGDSEKWAGKTNKVSYSKQIVHQHVCHGNFLPGSNGVVIPVKIFLLSSLITIQNLVAGQNLVGCHKVWAL